MKEIRVIFKNGMSHAKAFDNELEYEAVSTELTDCFLGGESKGAVLDDVVFRWADVLLLRCGEVINCDKVEA